MTLMKLDATEVLSEFEAVKSQAKQLRQNVTDSLFGSSDELENLVEAYKDAKLHFGRITTEQNLGVYLRDIEMKGRDYSAAYKQKALSRELDTECDKAITALKSLAPASSKGDFEILTTLKQQLEELYGAVPDANYEVNVNEAITAYERGAYLASALIASRVILYASDQIRGEFAEDKVQFLHDKGLVEADKRAALRSLIKAKRTAKRIFSRDITAFPSADDVLALLSDTVRMLELVSTVSKVEAASSEKEESPAVTE
ncbi:MAG: hypothetical protein JW878_08555 [Methanomicrobia archaeon]|nr:hypothetical protein [Methanomicrobia archaeon]